jgi:hypothetical protein
MRKVIEYTLVSADGVFEDPANLGLMEALSRPPPNCRVSGHRSSFECELSAGGWGASPSVFSRSSY